MLYHSNYQNLFNIIPLIPQLLTQVSTNYFKRLSTIFELHQSTGKNSQHLHCLIWQKQFLKIQQPSVFAILLLRKMFLNLYKLNFQRERKASVNDQFTRVMSALYCYHSKTTFHKSMSCSSDGQKPPNSFKCLQLWLMINEACTKKSFYMTMYKFSEVCIYVTVFYSLTFKSV